MERIEVQLMLLSVQSPEDNDLQITFDVTASALVREHGHHASEPGEILVEDIEINDVRMMSIGYGRFGASYPRDEAPGSSMAGIALQRRLDWLNSQLDDRDDWTDAIRAKVIDEYAKQEAVLV